ncbi:putative methyltransferase [Blattella germanica]|nr:putative methyltransferase [Blattella germanica]
MGPAKTEKGSTAFDIKQRKKERKKWKEQKLLRKLEKMKTIDKPIVVTGSDSECTNDTTEKINDLSTLSIAVPGSILENAQSAELRTYLAGQIARAAGVFKVDEIVVFDDLGSANAAGSAKEIEVDGDGKPLRRCCSQEGVTTNLPTKAGHGCVVNCGLLKDVIVDKNLDPGIRVTVKLLPREGTMKKMRGVIVPPHQPRAETGMYWGYNVRIAQSLSAVFSQSPYPGGYDITIGTSEKGDNIDDIPNRLPKHEHAIIVFGGLQGLEAALENDEMLTVEDPSLLFDCYLNTCPQQGSRTIRTEEAILITLSELRTKLAPKFQHTFTTKTS